MSEYNCTLVLRIEMQTIVGKDIDQVIELLNQDEVVAIPTETVYGLAGNALSATAIAKIFEAKNRPKFNPLIMHVAAVEEIQKYAEIDEATLKLIAHFMPGPLTVLLKKKDHVPDILTAGSDKVAVRVPNHPLTQKLLQQLNFPLAAPSANPSGYVSPTSAVHVLEGLNHKIPYILDGGNCEVGVESTIIEVLQDKIIVHRLGGVAVEDIQQQTNLPVVLQTHEARPQTSGKMKSHYATKTPLYIGNTDTLLNANKGKKIAVISLKKQSVQNEHVQAFPLSENGNLTEAAANLFAVMRMIDEGNFDLIITEKFPETGLGRAINDRLGRAQAIYKDGL